MSWEMKEIKINPLECFKHFSFLSSPIKYLLFEKITEKHFIFDITRFSGSGWNKEILYTRAML